MTIQDKYLLHLVEGLRANANIENAPNCIHALQHEEVVIHFGRPIAIEKVLRTYLDRTHSPSGVPIKSHPLLNLELVDRLASSSFELAQIDSVYTITGAFYIYLSRNNDILFGVLIDPTKNLNWVTSQFPKIQSESEESKLFRFRKMMQVKWTD